MTRVLSPVLAILALITAGCGTNQSLTGTPAEALPNVNPASGGELILIPAGTFTMGDSSGRLDETPHVVSLSSFYIDKQAVTQELYEKIMGVNPAKRKGKDNPV